MIDNTEVEHVGLPEGYDLCEGYCVEKWTADVGEYLHCGYPDIADLQKRVIELGATEGEADIIFLDLPYIRAIVIRLAEQEP